MTLKNNLASSIKNDAAHFSSESSMAESCAKNYAAGSLRAIVAIESNAKGIDLCCHSKALSHQSGSMAAHPGIIATNIASNCCVLLQRQKAPAAKENIAIRLQRHNGLQDAARIKKNVHERIKSRLPAALFEKFEPDFYGTGSVFE